MEKKDGKVKKWIKYNKAVVISLTVVLIYTLIMAGIIFGAGFGCARCSSGSLSDIDSDTVEIQTTMHRPESQR